MPTFILGVLLSVFAVLATSTGIQAASRPYAPHIHGIVAGFKLAGLEPDGDPLDQVVLQTVLSPAGDLPRLHLIVDSYLENFKPDTTPILPDLLNPKRTATNLGGFLQGKVLMTDDAGTVIALGSFLAEAFVGNSSNHAVMKLYGSGAGFGGTGALKGSFILHKDATLAGALSGRLILPAAALRTLRQHRNNGVQYFPRKLLTSIISTVSVQPAPMMGRATSGTRGAPLHTAFGTPTTHKRTVIHGSPAAPDRTISGWTMAAFAGAVVSFLFAVVFWWRGRNAGSGAKE